MGSRQVLEIPRPYALNILCTQQRKKDAKRPETDLSVPAQNVTGRISMRLLENMIASEMQDGRHERHFESLSRKCMDYGCDYLL